MVHSSAWRCTYMPPGHVFHGRGLVNLNVTSTPTPPLADPMTLPQAAEAACGSCAQQQRVRCRALDRRDPSTIIPNHPPHTAHVARTPSASTHSRCSYLAYAGCGLEDGGGWTSSTARGHLQSSWGRGPSRGPCWRAGRGRFRTARRTFIHTAARFCVLGSRGGGLGGWDRVGPTHS